MRHGFFTDWRLLRRNTNAVVRMATAVYGDTPQHAIMLAHDEVLDRRLKFKGISDLERRQFYEGI